MAAAGQYRRLEDPEEDSTPRDEEEEEMLLHVPEGVSGHLWATCGALGGHNSLTPPNIYRFHQRNGFACMVLADAFELGQFAFVVAFSTFLLRCVDYDVLFANRSRDGDRAKVTLPDALLPADQCVQRIRGSLWILSLLSMASVFWLYRLVRFLRSLLGYWEMRLFYTQALRIPSEELSSRSWPEVQSQLLDLQRRHPLCVHKELTELDIHHRILRFRNYAVAMVNKSLLPIRFQLPLVGSVVFLTRGLQYNLEMLLFRGPGSLFENPWSLRAPCKRLETRREVARGL
ncbi:ATG9A protein, partial [Piaya cayana]|nr:ATG9A protein [Piaya cayana]